MEEGNQASSLGENSPRQGSRVHVRTALLLLLLPLRFSARLGLSTEGKTVGCNGGQRQMEHSGVEVQEHRGRFVGTVSDINMTQTTVNI